MTYEEIQEDLVDFQSGDPLNVIMDMDGFDLIIQNAEVSFHSWISIESEDGQTTLGLKPQLFDFSIEEDTIFLNGENFNLSLTKY